MAYLCEAQSCQSSPNTFVANRVCMCFFSATMPPPVQIAAADWGNAGARSPAKPSKQRGRTEIAVPSLVGIWNLEALARPTESEPLHMKSGQGTAQSSVRLWLLLPRLHHNTEY